MRQKPFDYEIRSRTGNTRNLKQVTRDVRFPIMPFIADSAPPVFSKETQDIIRTAQSALSQSSRQQGLGGVMEGLLLRTEAVNSSKIEGKSSSLRNVCLASAGATSKEWARETLRNLECLLRILHDEDIRISEASLLRDHAVIMETKKHAGRFRKDGEEVHVSEANDLIEADYVAPLPERLPDLMRDWVAFTARQDIDIIPHVAQAHLQFECIHPFCDGNGRAGRAAMQRMLMAAGCRPVPVSAALHGIRSRYLEGFEAYANGDIDYPVRLHAIAFWAASEAIARHSHERSLISERWADKTGAHARQRNNLRAALEWIPENPAFTAEELNIKLGMVSEKTLKRLLSLLEEHEIISSNKVTHSKHNGRRLRIWEAKEIYTIGDAVEETAKRLAKDAAPPPYSPDSKPKPMPAAIKDSRKQEIATAIAESGAHPLLTLPTQDGYDYGFSAFEFFVLKDGKIELRTPAENVGLWFTGDDCEDMHLHYSPEPNSTGYWPTEYNASVPPKTEDPAAFDFAALSGRWTAHLNREISAPKELRAHWDWLLSEYAEVVKRWHTWKAIGIWNKYIGPFTINFPTEEYRAQVGRDTGTALFSALDSFLQPEPPNKVEEFKELRGDQWYSGYTPSLHVLVNVLKDASEVELHGIYDAASLFSEDQKASLLKIEKELEDLKGPNRFWKELRKHPDFSENGDRQNNLELISELAEKQTHLGKMATLITTARNAMAHNREDIDGQEWYLNTIGFMNGEEVVSRQAIDFIAATLRRIASQVLGMKPETLEGFIHKAETEAGILAAKTREAYDNADFAMQQRAQTEKNWAFRLNAPKDIFEHVCNLPYRMPRGILHPGLHLFKHFCQTCGGDTTVLGLQRHAPVEVEISTPRNATSVKGDLKKFMLGEGRYGRMSISLQFTEEASNTLPNILPNKLMSEKLLLKIYWHGEILFEGHCRMPMVVTGGGWGEQALSEENIAYIDWDAELDFYPLAPFCLPVARYREILNIQQALADTPHQDRKPALPPISPSTGETLAEDPAEYPYADRVRDTDTNEIVYRFLTPLSQRKQLGSILWLNTEPDSPDIAARETLLEVKSIRTTSTNHCEHLCRAA